MNMRAFMKFGVKIVGFILSKKQPNPSLVACTVVTIESFPDGDKYVDKFQLILIDL